MVAVLVLAATAASQAQSVYVIGPGREAEVQRFFAPHTLGGTTLPRGWTWRHLKIERTHIVVELAGPKGGERLSLHHPTAARPGDERIGAFAVRYVASAGMRVMVAALRKHAPAVFFARMAHTPKRSPRNKRVRRRPPRSSDAPRPRRVGARTDRAWQWPTRTSPVRMVALTLAGAATLFGLIQLSLWLMTPGRRRKQK